MIDLRKAFAELDRPTLNDCVWHSHPGVEHCPRSDGANVLLIEPRDEPNTGTPA